MNKCILYPERYEKQICKAGGNVSGTKNEKWICSEEYSETCILFIKYEEEVLKDIK